jgi:2-C-methyl-D-erythritol 4-phosphate cytidylyltransferase
MSSTWAIVVAGGEGSRLGADHPKAFVRLGGRPLLAHSIDLLEDHPAVDRMVLVVPAEWEEPATLLADELAAGKVAAAVPGGETRALSVAAGLDAVAPGAETILVHDAARPFASAKLIDRLLEALATHPGAVPALPVTDTVKRVSDGRVTETLDRSELRAVQTPQAFVASVVRDAYARGDVAAASDCSSLVEACGGRVRVVEGDPKLIKITDVGDLERVAALL